MPSPLLIAPLIWGKVQHQLITFKTWEELATSLEQRLNLIYIFLQTIPDNRQCHLTMQAIAHAEEVLTISLELILTQDRLALIQAMQTRKVGGSLSRLRGRAYTLQQLFNSHINDYMRLVSLLAEEMICYDTEPPFDQLKLITKDIKKIEDLIKRDARKTTRNSAADLQIPLDET